MTEPAPDIQTTEALFDAYHVGWETRDADLIASLHSADTIFHIHDGSEPVVGREALRQNCIETFEAFHFGFEMGRRLFGERHWVFEWKMVLDLTDTSNQPFTAKVEVLDVVTLNADGEVTRKDVFMNGKQAQAAFARAGIER